MKKAAEQEGGLPAVKGFLMHKNLRFYRHPVGRWAKRAGLK